MMVHHGGNNVDYDEFHEVMFQLLSQFVFDDGDGDDAGDNVIDDLIS